nr:glycosyltransferase family 9 protein [Bacteroidaceae bacterium]
QHPDVEFLVVTQKWLCALYEGVAPNISTYACEPHGRHSGPQGMWRLAKELRREGVDTVADLHDVLRTKMLRTFLMFRGCKVQHIDKGRGEKRELIQKGWKACPPLRPQTERYADVFRALGMGCTVDFKGLTLPTLPALPAKKAEERWIGVAPAAAHPSKTYPEEKLQKALTLLLDDTHVSLFFFGREDSVKAMAQQLQTSHEKRVCLVSDYAHGLREELCLMQQLDTMLSMDSGNMHLASLVGLRTVSVWGATHPAMGFLGYGQSMADCIQSDRPCRPCTTYGAKPRCPLPYPCLEDIAPEQIVEAINRTSPKEK